MANEYVIKNGLIVGALNYPTTDGAAGDVFTTDGSGNVTLQTPSGGTSGAGSVERVRVDYNASFDITGVTDETAGVTTTIVDAASAQISMAFTGHSYPPVSILTYAFDGQNNRWHIQSPTGWASGSQRYVQGGDVNFGSFSSNGPLDLQVDETNLSGLSTTLGGLPTAYILMWFLD